jgi:hypothetical protein
MNQAIPNGQLRITEAAPELICAPQVNCEYFRKIGATITEEATFGTVTIQDEQFTLPVIILTDDQLLGAIAPKPFPREYECRVGDRLYPFFSPKEGTAKIAEPPIDVKSEPETDGQKVLGPLFLRFLEEVATNVLGGMNIVLHPRLPSAMHAPIKDKVDTVHIFLECVPTPPASECINPMTTFDIHVLTGEGYEACLLPSPRRGVILSDGTHDVVQIIGNNIYVLFDPLRLLGLGIHAASTVFFRTIALAINGLIKRGELKNDEEAPRATKEGLSALVLEFVTKRKTAAAEFLKTKQEKIKRLEETLRDEKRDLVRLARLYRALEESDFYRFGADRLIEDHARMLLHPLVASVVIIPESAIEVRTKMITILHEGKDYRIGTFAIRFGFNDPLLIWAEETFHPEGEPHPHLSAHNGTCFGNTDAAIEDALLEYRYADALDYIMLWLGSYTPELVIWHKIEEWPLEETKETHEMENTR